jgi:hypothetical protein
MVNGAEVTVRLTPQEVKVLLMFDKDLAKAIHKMIKRYTRTPKDSIAAQAYEYLQQYVPPEGILESHLLGILKEWARNKLNEMVAKGAIRGPITDYEVSRLISDILSNLKKEGFYKVEIKHTTVGKERISKIGDFTLEAMAEMAQMKRMISFV